MIGEFIVVSTDNRPVALCVALLMLGEIGRVADDVRCVTGGAG